MASKQASAYGSVIISSQANQAIQTYGDLARKRVGVALPLSTGAFQLGWEVRSFEYSSRYAVEVMLFAQYMDHHGLNIYTSSSQVEKKLPVYFNQAVEGNRFSTGQHDQF